MIPTRKCAPGDLLAGLCLALISGCTGVEALADSTSATVSAGAVARGGSIESDRPGLHNGLVLVNSGYLFGDRMAGNALLVFATPDAVSTRAN